ncbi:MAG: hypothetical protein IPJ55_09010 [Chloracidobacterium sp.]|nr:hypothetical protein [Chloracidobacterium sp.]
MTSKNQFTPKRFWQNDGTVSFVHYTRKKMIHPEVNPLREWKQIILQLKGLEKVDGRPLYKYRLSTKEFDALEDFLTNWVSDYGQHNDFSVIASQPGFSDLFVLFCQNGGEDDTPERASNGSQYLQI